MTTTQTDTVALDQLLSAFPLPALEPGQRPAHVWGYFETVDDDGDATWHERASDDVDVAAVYAEISGYLAGLEEADVWFDDDEVIDAASDEDAAVAEEAPLDARFNALRIEGLGDAELTGRLLLLVLSTDEDGEPARDVYSPGLSDEEVMGLLRLAQLRLTEVLAWDVDAPTASTLDEEPARVPLTELFTDWEFETVDEVAEITGVWALVETTDDDGTVTWVQRETEGLPLSDVLSLLAVRVTGVEERLLAEWELADLVSSGALSEETGDEEDAEDSEPSDEELRDDELDDEDDDFDEDAEEFAPLDERFEALTVAALPEGTRARRALLIVLAKEADEAPRYALYGADPAEELDFPYLEEIEELGLLRSQERRLRRELAW